MADTKKKKKQNPRHGRPRLSLQFYEKLLDAYRANPGNHAGSAKVVGCARKTAKRGWDFGWNKFEWAPPIKDVIAQEQVSARARVQQSEEMETETQWAIEEALATDTPLGEVRQQAYLDRQAERAKAKEQAIAARKAEGQMVGGIRKAATQSAASLLRIGNGINALADRVDKELATMAAKPKDFKVGAALVTINKYASAVRDLTIAGKTAVELERLHLGDPTSIVGVQLEGAFDEAPMDDVMREISKAAQAIADAKEKGIDLNAEPGAEPKPPTQLH